MLFRSTTTDWDNAASTTSLFPSISGNGSKLVAINSGGTAYEYITQNDYLRSDTSDSYTGSGTLTIGSSATLDVNGTLKTDSLEPRTTAGDIFGLSSGGPLSGGGRVAVGFNSFATNEDVVTMKTGPILHITNPKIGRAHV